MKKYRGKTGTKIAVFVACLVLITATFFGAAMTMFCAEFGFYQGKTDSDILFSFYERTFPTNTLKAFEAGEKNNYNIDNFTRYEFAIIKGNVSSKKELEKKSNYIASNFSHGFPEKYSVDYYRIGEETEYSIGETYMQGSWYYNHFDDDGYDPTLEDYTVVSSVNNDSSNGDLIGEATRAFGLAQAASTWGMILFIGGGIAAVVLFVILMSLSGYHGISVEAKRDIYQAKEVSEGVYLQRRIFDKIPMDVSFLLILTVETLLIAGVVTFLSELSWDLLGIISCITVVFVAAGVFCGLIYCMTLASNFKCPKWWKNLFCVMIVTGIIGWFKKIRETSYETGKYIQMKKRIWMIFGLITAGEFFGLFAFASDAWRFGVLFFFWFVEKVVFGVVLFKLLNQFAEIKKVTKEIKEGNLNASVATGKMFLDLREEGDAINSIGRGLDNAIEERLKSERFQTELITNVSHDIKTPLTSIINYVDLLKKEKPEGAKVKEYLEVLDRQSQRLKKLLQDLLDASKASTGNVELHMEKVDVDVLLNQTLGEFEEKLEAKGIEFKVKALSSSPKIMADSRYLWRVFDNLMNNICKYGQDNTRAYVNLEVRDAKVKISFLNTSKEELNITGEELMQRFVRGDSSRNTEGSGLGLSIAKSLTELMKGTMDLSVDGDLFKVVLAFDAC